MEPTPESLYTRIPSLGLEAEYFEDIRDFSAVSRIIKSHNPSVIFHLAAQPLVIESYRTPRETFETNVMGTANLLEAFGKSKNALLFAGITTDKVYKNLERARRFQEGDPLSGKDPYSASKVGTESALAAWRQISTVNQGPQVLSLRAGNVIGGGDFASDRIVPDIVRGLKSGEAIQIRNPESTRPWQHVLDPLRGYLMSVWEKKNPEILYEAGSSNLEAATLQLDSSLSKEILNWKPVWSQERAIRDTFTWWDKVFHKDISAEEACLHDIDQASKWERA